MRKKIILLVGIIVISSFSIGYITSILISNSILNNNDTPKFYIAIDDIEIRVGTNPFESNVKIAYDYDSVPIGGGRGFLMRFDLRNKPRSWSKCVISPCYRNVYLPVN